MDRHNQSPLGADHDYQSRDESSGTNLQLTAPNIREERNLKETIPFRVVDLQQVRSSGELLDDDDDVVQGESPRLTLPSTPATVPKSSDGEFLEITNTVGGKHPRKTSEDGPSG